ncbi:hypothetical protein G8A07_12110 [Roseateles sp. DAIF2]|uniref:hypothetical protein n=1 Tax=Roseateles sp. DAIF2 TaxID=2714952 RepID=UPI0018A2D773|nr:hypothetical protein [Roseateles sp. DAIF2]QPF73594.1 hypothetical protein G8A07_12110 [Roseateles sp. DAIF2]
MSTAPLNLPLHVMPFDAARIGAARSGGERLVTAGAALGRTLLRFAAMIGEGRARSELRELADRTEASRPELAASLRQAARRSWLD